MIASELAVDKLPQHYRLENAFQRFSSRMEEKSFVTSERISPDPHVDLNVHPRSKRLIFRDLNFEVYNPKVGYTDLRVKKVSLLPKIQDKQNHSFQTDIGSNSKMFENMLERTATNNMKFSDKILEELEKEAKLSKDNKKEGKCLKEKNGSASPYKTLRVLDSTRTSQGREVSLTEINNTTTHNTSTDILPSLLIDKKNPKKFSHHTRLESINSRSNSRQTNLESTTTTGFEQVRSRNLSHDFSMNNRTKTPSVMRTPPKKEKNTLNLESSKFVVVKGNIIHEKSAPSNNHSFRKALYKVFHKGTSGKSQGSNTEKTLYYDSFVTR